MQDSTNLKIPASAAIQMQAQLSNLIAIQNLQEYLKYLILTTSVEPQTMTATPQKLLQSSPEKTVPLKQDTAMKIEEEGFSDEYKISLTPTRDHSFSTNASESPMNKRKRSYKLFTLMQKRFAGKNKEQDSNETSGSNEEKSRIPPILKKSANKVVHCGHPWRDHYAKGLCGSCYLRFGRTKKPWNCSHDKLYALGLCQKCYTTKYHMKKKSVENSALNEIKFKMLGPGEESREPASQNLTMEVESKKVQLLTKEGLVADLGVKIETS